MKYAKKQERGKTGTLSLRNQEAHSHLGNDQLFLLPTHRGQKEQRRETQDIPNRSQHTCVRVCVPFA